MSKRKQNFVDSAVQGQLIRRVLGHWLIFFAVLMMTVMFFNLLLGSPEKPLADRVTEPFRQYILLAIIMFSLLPAFMLDTVRFSNRFVGPIYRLRRAMRELAETGDVEPLKFRNNDFWGGAAAEFNELAQQIRQAKQPSIATADQHHETEVEV